MSSTRGLLLLAALGVGCAASTPTTKERPPPEAPAASSSAPSASAASVAPIASSTETPFPAVGIGECDAYIARYRACMSTQHDPREVDARARAMSEAWRKAGATDGGRSAMVAACSQATASLGKVPGCEP